MMSNQPEQEWLYGRGSLGTAAGWTMDEMRLVADLGFALAEQGCTTEAVTIFEGLAALAPATAYFQAALGALNLRQGDAARAVNHLDAALAQEQNDIASLINRGEAYMQLGDFTAAENDLSRALEHAPHDTNDAPIKASTARAHALLLTLQHRRAALSPATPTLIAQRAGE